ncbi:ABC transporter permease [soil metagenome]
MSQTTPAAPDIESGELEVKDSAAAQRRSRLIRTLQTQAIAGVLIVLVIIFSIASPYFFTLDNFINMGGTFAILGIMAVSQTFLVVSKGIDISIGSVAAVAGVLLGFFYSNGVNIWIGVVLSLLAGLAIGMLNGLLIVRLGLDPLVATLGAYSIFQGLAFVISGTKTLVISDAAFNFLGAGNILGIPFTLVLFILVLGAAIFVERRTSVGRAIFAIGGNQEAARLSGIRVKRIRITLYALSGLTAAVAGILLASQLGTSSPNVGTTYLLSVVTAVVLGGSSLDGGRGSLLGTLLAVAILGVLQNGFALLAFSSFAQQIVLGALLIAAVTMDTATRRRRK